MATAETQQLTGIAAHIIKRPRLTKILDETEARIILLCAPAGYGKTTLAREWVATRSEPVYWYSGGPAMADVAALAVDLADVFAGEKLANKMTAIAARGATPRELAKCLAAAVREAGGLLVVDEYEHAGQSPAAENFFGSFVHETGVRMLITSRTAPGWLGARRVLYGEALRLGADALAFSEDEISQVSPGLSAIALEANGWPALVRLAALREGHESAAPSEPTALYDFFATELYEAADYRLKQALHILALGGDATEEISSAALGIGHDQLLGQARSLGFIPAETAQPRIHPLLRSFLLRRLRAEPKEVVVSSVYSVVDLLSTYRRWDDCLATLTEVPTAPLVVSTLEAALNDLLESGRVATVARWIDLALRLGCDDTAVVRLAQAELAVRDARGDEARVLGEQAASLTSNCDIAARGHLAAARGAHLAEDTPRVIDNARRAEELSSDQQLRMLAIWLAFVHAFERDDPRAIGLRESLREMAAPGTQDVVRVACADAHVELASSGPRRALAALKGHDVFLDSITDPLLVTNFLYLRASLQCLLAEYDLALSSAQQLRQVAESTGVNFAISYSLLLAAQAAVGTRRIAEAKRLLARVRRESTENAHINAVAVVTAAKARIAAGDLAGAELLLRPDPEPQNSPAMHAEHAAIRGLILAARGRSRDAAACFDNAEGLSPNADGTILARLGRAVLSANGTVGVREDHLEALRDALHRGFLDSVVVASRASLPLARAATSSFGLAQELASLYAKSNDVDLARAAGIDLPRELRRGERLSKREREVFELVRQGRTNRQIARTLFISESTAKVHVRHIFEKLGVRSRAEAAAHELD